MNKRLKDYIDELFAQIPNTTYANDLKEEMLTNLSDKYEDLLVEGKSKEEAFLIVTSSIGDIRELLSGLDETAVIITTRDIEKRRQKSALITSIAVMMYILSGAVLIGSAFVGLEEFGLLGVIIIVAGATGLLIYDNATKPEVLKDDQEKQRMKQMTPHQRKTNTLMESVIGIIWTLITAIYFGVSFIFGIWAYSWIIFIIGAAITQIIKLLFELKE